MLAKFGETGLLNCHCTVYASRLTFYSSIRETLMEQALRGTSSVLALEGELSLAEIRPWEDYCDGQLPEVDQ
jgi:hypothetical protein